MPNEDAAPPRQPWPRLRAVISKRSGPGVRFSARPATTNSSRECVSNMPRRLSPTPWARGIVLLCHLALLVALPLLAGRLGVVVALLLLLPLHGLWRERPYTYAWTSLLITVYL